MSPILCGKSCGQHLVCCVTFLGYFSSEIPTDSQGLRPLVLRLMVASLATLLHEEGVRHTGVKTAFPWHRYSEEILKEHYAENFFNKLVLQTFKGQLLDEWKYGLDLNSAH